MNHRNIIVLGFLLIPAMFTGSVLAIAGNISDGIRLGLLSLPGTWLLYVALHKPHIVWKFAAILWWGIFWTDALLRSASWFLFKSDTDAHFIIQAIANTTTQESMEFLQFHAWSLSFGALLVVLISLGYFLGIFKLLPKLFSKSLFKSKATRYSRNFLVILAVASYIIEPSRAQHPLFYWTDYFSKIQAFKNQIKTHKQVQETWQKNADHNLISGQHASARQTHTLVITDSITSQNLSVCGYERHTTPALEKYAASFQIFCNAYSPAASTISSLKMTLTDAEKSTQEQYASESVLAYAKAAGFKVYWISNQNDSYISSLFGSFVDEQVYVNHRSGRSSASLDENLLPIYQDVLKDPFPKKLIIVHFIGAHPNYQLRYPENFSKFTTETNDIVEQKLEQNDIGFWVQQQRNHYDNSIVYQDWLIDRFFKTFQNNDIADFRSFIFVSDHGNEVGHEIDFAGHSPSTKAGYQVPLVIWYDGIKDTGVDVHKAINTADLDDSMMSLMGLREKNKQYLSPNLLNQDYLFKPSADWPYWQ